MKIVFIHGKKDVLLSASLRLR